MAHQWRGSTSMMQHIAWFSLISWKWLTILYIHTGPASYSWRHLVGQAWQLSKRKLSWLPVFMSPVGRPAAPKHFRFGHGLELELDLSVFSSSHRTPRINLFVVCHWKNASYLYALSISVKGAVVMMMITIIHAWCNHHHPYTMQSW